MSNEVTAAPQAGVVRSDRGIAGKTFKLYPVDNWPDAWVLLRRVGDTRKNQIYDEFKVDFVGRKPQNAKLTKSTEKIQSESFIDMGGWFDGDATPDSNGLFPSLESSPENFVRIAKYGFEHDGERVTVWLRCEQLIDEELAAVQGNSKPSSGTTSVAQMAAKPTAASA